MMISFLRWLTFAVSLIWVLVYFKGGSSIVADNKRVAANTQMGRSYMIAMMLISFAGIMMLLTQSLICLGIVGTPGWAERWWVVLFGAIMVITGIAAEFWIRYGCLGRFWSGSVEIQDNHKVIANGPYGIIRHPLYAFNLLIYPGAVLVFGVWWNWILCAMVLVGYILLTAYEDEFLEGNLPGYPEYQQRTKYRFFPGVW
jgi:protein-S-isoprenylcysteine O-methyltransferase Ste14